MSEKMNPEIKAKWVEALRSGKYRQSAQRLLNDGRGGFCCLGVLCDVYAQEAGAEWEWTLSSDALRLKVSPTSTYYPPIPVREWADFHEDTHMVEIEGHRESVAVHNDGVSVRRRTFVEIADAIEAQL